MATQVSATPQLEIVGLWLIGVGSFVAMAGLVIQRPTGIDGMRMGMASRLARGGYAASVGGAVWSAVGGGIVAAENIPHWSWWIVLTLLVVAASVWAAGASIYHRDAKKLLAEASKTEHVNPAYLAARKRQAEWSSAFRHPFASFKLDMRTTEDCL